MKSEKRKGLLIIVGLLLLGGSIVIMTNSSEEKKSSRKSGKKFLKVHVYEIDPKAVNFGISITGKTIAKNKIEIFSEVNGIFNYSSEEFKAGSAYKMGQVLVALDSREVKLELKTSRSKLASLLTGLIPDISLDFPEETDKWKNFLEKLDASSPLPPLPTITNTKERYFLNANGFFEQYYSIERQEVRLSKYVLTAPFNGTLSEALINKGTLVRPGQKLGTLIQNDIYEIESSINVIDAQYISPGDEVTLTSPDLKGSWKGTVARINSSIDPETQTLSVFADVKGPKLKEGLFLDGKIKGKRVENAVFIPRSSILDNHVFLLRDSLVFRHPVNISNYEGDRALVSGLEKGNIIATDRIEMLKDSMKVNPLFNE